MALERLALLAKLQPVTPWRCGGERAGRAASVVASDAWFDAIGAAMERLGWGAEWASEGPAAVRISSLLPFLGDTFFAPVPETARRGGGYRRLRMEAVRFAPFAAVAAMGAGKLEESQWILDLASGCLLPADRAGAGGPFRRLARNRFAVDRVHGAGAEAVRGEGIEFAPGGGVWSLFVFGSSEAAAIWLRRLEAAVRLAADDGIGGWRSAGWGRSRRPRLRGAVAAELLRGMGWEAAAQDTGMWWTLGLYNPGAADGVDWTSGAYSTLVRRGWTAEGKQRAGARLVREGAILLSSGEPAHAGTGLGMAFGGGLALPWTGGEAQ